jgi:hypothetical protein
MIPALVYTYVCMLIIIIIIYVIGIERKSYIYCDFFHEICDYYYSLLRVILCIVSRERGEDNGSSFKKNYKYIKQQQNF